MIYTKKVLCLVMALAAAVYLFGCSRDSLLDAPLTVVTPDSKNPYRQMYVAN